MDDMIESMTGDAMLGRRLEAYAAARLSPDLTTSSRLRARVLAVAHRQADLARGDAALVVLPRTEPSMGAAPSSARVRALRQAPRHRGRARWQRAAGVLLAAGLGIGLTSGVAFAARPAGPLYDARLWAEALALPADPSARAVAELDRLERRLGEVAAASHAGDTPGVTAALAAYEAIVDEASASAILTGDDVAAAILETGVGQNLAILRGLVAGVPADAGAAISNAVDDAIERSSDAVDKIGASRPASGGSDGTGKDAGGQATDPTPRPTKTPSPEPAVVPAQTATPKPKPTHDVPPASTPKPTDSPTPEDGGGKSGQPGQPKPSHGPGIKGG
jgi:hypothetical protein